MRTPDARIRCPRRWGLAGLTCLVVLTQALMALEPATPEEMERYRQDGSLPARLEAAQAIGNHRVSPRLAQDAALRLAALQGTAVENAPAPPVGWRGMPTKGTVRLFSLLIAFADTPFSNPASEVDAKLFGDGSGGYPYESLRNFYRRSSMGLLEIQGSTLGWYTAPYARGSVPQSSSGREGLIKEALDSFEAQGHDFSQYDNDGDGYVDYFLVIWTGADNGWANFWWGYQTSFADQGYQLDGKRLGSYSWQWEARPFPGPFKPRVTIHETGHALGLPDYYDYDDSVGPRGGVGGLDQMDANWGDHNCFSKFLLDWITPTFCSSADPHPASLGPAASTGEALLVSPNGMGGSAFGEYFMVQYRARELNDYPFTVSGMLVWHLDAGLDMSGTDFLFNNSYTDHKLLRLMEADGLEEIEQGRSANMGDYYLPGASLGPETHPDSDRYDGIPTGIRISDIAAPGATMDFTLQCSGGDPCGTSRPTIQAVKWVGSTKTLQITGTGFRSGQVLLLFGQPIKTKYKKATRLNGKTASFPRRQPIEVRVSDPATGCLSEPFVYARP